MPLYPLHHDEVATTMLYSRLDIVCFLPCVSLTLQMYDAYASKPLYGHYHQAHSSHPTLCTNYFTLAFIIYVSVLLCIVSVMIQIFSQLRPQSISFFRSASIQFRLMFCCLKFEHKTKQKTRSRFRLKKRKSLTYGIWH